MKHPLQTVHRQTYGFIYRLLQQQPFQNKWNKKKSFYYFSRAVILIAILWFAQYYYYFMYTYHFDTTRNNHPKVCRRMKYLRAIEIAKYDSLAEQLNIHDSFLNIKDDSARLKKLLPITKLLLQKNKRICPLEPPHLRGKLNVYKNETTVEADLMQIRRSLKERNIAAASLHDFHSDVASVDKNTKVANTSQKKNEVPSFKSRLNDMSFSKPINASSVQLPLYSDQAPFGVNSPIECFPHRRTAIIIPYRNREEHLKLFLRHIHDFMLNQQVEYGIYIINLAGNTLFNRAKLLNIGYIEALYHYGRYDCIIFHDVDLLPEDDRNIYTCNKDPKHMSVAINVFGYQLPYPEIYGGVSAMTPFQFELVNGYSNEYWGWGGEDDDMYYRLTERCMRIFRISDTFARYVMIKHTADKGNEASLERLNLLAGARNRLRFDGLTSLKYKVINREYHLLYNNITVEIGHADFAPQTKSQLLIHYSVVVVCLILLFLMCGKRSKT